MEGAQAFVALGGEITAGTQAAKRDSASSSATPRNMPAIRSGGRRLGRLHGMLQASDGIGDELELAVPVAIDRRLADPRTAATPSTVNAP